LSLNGRRLKLRGLNRRQTYPYVGGAMPARVQRQDVVILKRELKLHVGDQLVDEVTPDRGELGYLPHPPFVTEKLQASWGQHLQDLRIEGYVGDDLVVTRTFAARSTDAQLHLEPGDHLLVADGSDATRVVIRVTDRDGNRRQFATIAVQLELTGPGALIGDRLLALAGGVAAVWIKSAETPGTIQLRATTEHLGSQSVTIETTAIPPEPF
jgi:beta-galactosidase